jgi:hypothetical protein
VCLRLEELCQDVQRAKKIKWAIKINRNTTINGWEIKKLENLDTKIKSKIKKKFKSTINKI